MCSMKDMFPDVFEVPHNPSFEPVEALWYSYGELKHLDYKQEDALATAVIWHDRLVSLLKQIESIEDETSMKRLKSEIPVVLKSIKNHQFKGLV